MLYRQEFLFESISGQEFPFIYTQKEAVKVKLVQLVFVIRFVNRHEYQPITELLGNDVI